MKAQTQTSSCGNFKVVPRSSPFGQNEIWWDLYVKSPVNGRWVEVQGGTSHVSWFRELGFKA